MESKKKLVLITLASYFSVLTSLIIVVFFHLFREDHNPIMQTMSEYTIGDFGFLFPIALLILGLSSILALYSLHLKLPKTKLSKKILRYFSLWTVFIILTGIFPTDYITGPYTFSGITHALSSYFAFLFFLIDVYYISLFCKKDINLNFDYIRFLTYFILSIPGLVIFLIVPLQYKGLTQRIFLTIIIIAYIDVISIPIRNIPK